MANMLVLLILTAAGLFGVSSTKSVRIAGGKDADITDYPYQVSLLFYDLPGCGGTILNQRFILTAANCTYDVPAFYITVRVGSSFRSQGGAIYSVDKIYVHPNYNPKTYDYDISILELASPLQFGSGVRPVALASAGTIIVNGLSAVATGWGATSENGQPSEQLQVINVPTIITNDCKKYYQALPDRTFCAGYEAGGMDTCFGDNGGPLVVSGILIGITSTLTNRECGAARNPGVYTRVPDFRDYIEGIIRQSL